MSGKPNAESVKQLRSEFIDFVYARKQFSLLEGEIEQKAKELKEQRLAMETAHANIKSLLEKMDVATPGNFGWEGRHFEMLAMLSGN